jgi:hypothetical protein
MDQTFTVKGLGQSTEITGDPGQLTLKKALSQWTSRSGTPVTPTHKVRAAGRTYSDKDFEKSFTDLGISSGEVIEIVDSL